MREEQKYKVKIQIIDYQYTGTGDVQVNCWGQKTESGPNQ
jgi:hypothetical protein